MPVFSSWPATSPPPPSSPPSPPVAVVVVAARGGDEREREQQCDQRARRFRMWFLLLGCLGSGRRRRVEARAVGRVEEVEAGRVDHELDRLALARRRAGVAAGEDRRAAAQPPAPGPARAPRRRRRPRAPARPRSWPAARRCVKCTTTSEPSASRRSTVDEMRCSAGASGDERGVLHVLGPDAEHDVRPTKRRRPGRAADLAPGSAAGSRRTRRPVRRPVVDDAWRRRGSSPASR